MEMKPGSRWKSVVCETEVAIVRPPKSAVVLECGGYPMIQSGGERPAGIVLDETHAGGSLLGKRYADAVSGLEILCTKAGKGSLAVDGRAVAFKEAKRLPSSD